MQLLKNRLRQGLVASSIAAYSASLILPAMRFSHRPALLGYELLAWGWWGAILLQFAWTANPLYYRALLYAAQHKRIPATFSALLALVLGLGSLFTAEWYFSEGQATPIAGYGPGFYLWLLSFVLLMCACHRALALPPKEAWSQGLPSTI